MIWIDYAIVGLIGISLVIGLIRGFVKEAFSLAMWGVAIWVGLNFSREFSGFLVSVVSLPSARIAAAYRSTYNSHNFDCRRFCDTVFDHADAGWFDRSSFGGTG